MFYPFSLFLCKVTSTIRLPFIRLLLKVIEIGNLFTCNFGVTDKSGWVVLQILFCITVVIYDRFLRTFGLVSV